MQVEQHILEILERSALDGAILRLPPTQLDRATYTAINKIIEAAGGKWNRKAQAHVFSGEAADTIEPILLTGAYTRTKQDFGQFDSPKEAVERVIVLAGIERGMRVLEPSAGLGNIALRAAEIGATVDCYEIDQARFTTLRTQTMAGVPYGSLWRGDFLVQPPHRDYDRVVMNPPFARQADIAHVMHASKFLKPGGRLVSVMSSSMTFRSDARSQAFREMIDGLGGQIEPLSAGTFKDSGTMVNAVIVSFNALTAGETAQPTVSRDG